MRTRFRGARLTLAQVGAGALLCLILACGGDTLAPANLEPASTISISPVPDTLLTRQQLTLSAIARNSHGVPLLDRPATWSSSDPMVATVSPGGVLRALTAGTAMIRVATSDAADSQAVAVRALNLTQLFIGGSMTCGLDSEGEAWCWGHVGAEGSGNGSLDSTVVSLPTRAASGYRFSTLALAAGGACGIESEGQVVCWGQNNVGQLGDGSTIARGAPAPVPGLTDAIQILGGGRHFCARTSSGDVWCWGDNARLAVGQPGWGVVTTPFRVPLAGGANGLAVGDQHSCALVGTQAYCWGSDGDRQLGHDTTYDRLVPTRAATGGNASHTWVQVAANNFQTCARDSSGSLACWGSPYNSPPEKTTWSPEARLTGVTATAITAGWDLACAVSSAADAWCIGPANNAVKLGPSLPVVAVAATSPLPCILDNAGAVSCAVNFYAGDGTLSSVTLPATAVRIAASDGRICAVLASGATYCWSDSGTPAPRQAFASVTAVNVFGNSGSRLCVIATDAGVYCGNGRSETVEPTGGHAFAALAVGDYHMCGLTAEGAAWCWGENAHGKLGDGTTMDRASPVAVAGGHVFTSIAAGWEHTCGTLATGELFCWGQTTWGQFGLGTHGAESGTPVTVDGAPGLTAISGRLYGGCGLDASGQAWCWPGGRDTTGARPVQGATGLASLASETCGLKMNGSLLCWWYNADGYFGDGSYDTFASAAAPSANGIHFRTATVRSGNFGGIGCGVALDGSAWCWGDPWALGGNMGSPDGAGSLIGLPVRLYGSP